MESGFPENRVFPIRPVFFDRYGIPKKLAAPNQCPSPIMAIA
jgi:hypothetical protein